MRGPTRLATVLRRSNSGRGLPRPPDPDTSRRRDPAQGSGGAGGPATPGPVQPWPRWAVGIVVGLLVVLWAAQIVGFAPREERVELPYSAFLEQVRAGNVERVTTRSNSIDGEFRVAVLWPPAPAAATGDAATGGAATGETPTTTATPPTVLDDDVERASYDEFRTERPEFAQDDLNTLLLANGVQVEAKAPKTSGSNWGSILWLVIEVGIFVLLIVWMMRRLSGASGGGVPGTRSSHVRVADPAHQRTSFADVAGIDECKEELVEIVQFLRNPEKYRRFGAAIPHGVLLTGPPGTGKTLLARAVAGEAGVPFFSISASEFMELFVGMGARRVRELFEEARKAAPAIVFIDEIDAVGRTRGPSVGVGSHEEREQTLNQILTEMDGFSGTEGVIVLAATNRPDTLDPALLRAGRFDRHVVVPPPDRVGRAAILRVHTRSVPLGPSVDLDGIAGATTGLVGADLKNLVNEAALLAAKREGAAVEREDFSEALEKVLLGTRRRLVLSAEERRRTAYHEAGHALLGMVVPGADPVRKVSIVPRGRALGATMQTPDSDRYGFTEAYLRGRLIGTLAGRGAEQVVFGDTSSGAESDLDQATKLARQMVGRWGMADKIGPVAVLPGPGESIYEQLGPSPAMRDLLDEETRRLIDQCYDEAVTLLGVHRDKLDALADALLDKETLDEDDAYRAAGVRRPASLHPLNGPGVGGGRDGGSAEPVDVPAGSAAVAPADAPVGAADA